MRAKCMDLVLLSVTTNSYKGCTGFSLFKSAQKQFDQICIGNSRQSSICYCVTSATNKRREINQLFTREHILSR